MEHKTKLCTLPVGSVTSAMKARRLLAERFIDSSAVRETRRSGGGCSYALEFDCRQYDAVIGILKAAGMNITS